MASYTIVTSTAANVAGDSTNINTTKVKVLANNACYYAINQPASSTANVGPLIPANFPTFINMKGIGNKLSVLPTSGVSTAVTLTECGTVYQSAMNQNTITLLFTLQANTIALGSSTAGLKTGMYVSGTGIWANSNTTITAIATDSNITLSNAATITGDSRLTFTVNQIQSA